MNRDRYSLLFAGVIAVVTLLLLEAGAAVTLRAFAKDPRFDFTPVRERLAGQTESLRALLNPAGKALLQPDAELGWVYGAGHKSGRYTSNAQGARSLREYASKPAPGTLRIAAFGDSFVYGSEVGDREVWSAQLEQLVPEIEVLNFGVGGYGTDQAVLRHARRGATLGAAVSLLGFVEPDYARNVNRYRRFQRANELPLFKPRFRLEARGELELIPNPFPGSAVLARLLDDPWAALEAGPGDFFYDPLVWENPLYDRIRLVRLVSTVLSSAWRSRLSGDRLYAGGQMNEKAEAFRLVVALVERFESQCRAFGQRCALVVFPSRDADVWRDERTPAYGPLLAALEERGTWVVDVAEALGAAPDLSPDTLWASGHHYTPAGHRVVASALRNALREAGLLPRP